MAENDNSDAGDGDNGKVNDDAVELAAAIYEGRLLLEAGRVGIETLVNRPTPASIAELGVVLRLLHQAGDALETAQQTMFKLFGVSIGHA
jgi:hypothetical protein